MRIDAVLVAALELVNGAGIVQESPNEAECRHVEPDGHDLVLAEDVRAETYQDIGNRAAFENGAIVLRNPALDGDGPQPCLPYAGVSSAVRERLIRPRPSPSRNALAHLQSPAVRLHPGSAQAPSESPPG